MAVQARLPDSLSSGIKGCRKSNSPPHFMKYVLFIRSFAGLSVKRQKIQPAQTYRSVDDPGKPADSKEGFYQIEIEKSDQSPVYSADYADRQSNYIPSFHKRTPPVSCYFLFKIHWTYFRKQKTLPVIRLRH